MNFEPVERISPKELKQRLTRIHKKLTFPKQKYNVDKEVYSRLTRHANKIMKKGFEENSSFNLDRQVAMDFEKGKIAGLAKPKNGLKIISDPLLRRKITKLFKGSK
jgi:hypothetical protein